MSKQYKKSQKQKKIKCFAVMCKQNMFCMKLARFSLDKGINWHWPTSAKNHILSLKPYDTFWQLFIYFDNSPFSFQDLYKRGKDVAVSGSRARLASQHFYVNAYDPDRDGDYI